MASLPSRRQIFALALPVILANMSTPLLGMTDTLVMGRYPDAVHLAAIGLAATAFSLLFWSFSFLRQTTTGLAAQAQGADDTDALYAHLIRPLLVAIAIGCILLLLQKPIAWVLFGLLGGAPEVQKLAHAYYFVRIWSAPFALANYALFAWFLGQGRVRMVLLLQLIMNISNIVLTVYFVLYLDWGIKGAGLGTLLASASTCLLALWWVAKDWPAARWQAIKKQLKHSHEWRYLWGANGNVMVRTLLLTGANAILINRSAALGTTTLAVNQVLMQVLILSSHFVDGFSDVAEIYGGRIAGVGDAEGLKRLARHTGRYTLGAAIAITLVLTATATFWVPYFSVAPQVQQAISHYLLWVTLLPLVSVAAFHLDGIYMGATATRAMRQAMIASFVVYIIALLAFIPLWGNHGLWLAYWCFMAARGVTLVLAWPALKRHLATRYLEREPH